MKNLNELAIKYKTDKKIPDGKKAKNGLYGHGYTPYYEQIFEGKKIKNLLEIGISFGGSLLMWNEFLPKTNIYGMDISDKRFKKKRQKLEDKGIHIYIGDQANPKDLQVFRNIDFDVIIDDGGHRMQQQQVSFAELFPTLKSGGMYIIEDLHTSNKASFWDSFPEITTMQVLKKAIIKKNEKYRCNYITESQLKYIIDNTKAVDFYADKKLCVIIKK